MTYFAKIGKPKELRISILEAAKETIGCIAKHRKLKEIRKEKQKMIHEVKRELSHISDICTHLEDLFPHKELKKEALKEEAERKRLEIQRKPALDERKLEQKIMRMRRERQPAPQKTPETPKMPETQSLTDVDRLEYTLQKIEKKLAELNQ